MPGLLKHSEQSQLTLQEQRSSQVQRPKRILFVQPNHGLSKSVHSPKGSYGMQQRAHTKTCICGNIIFEKTHTRTHKHTQPNDASTAKLTQNMQTHTQKLRERERKRKGINTGHTKRELCQRRVSMDCGYEMQERWPLFQRGTDRGGGSGGGKILPGTGVPQKGFCRKRMTGRRQATATMLWEHSHPQRTDGGEGEKNPTPSEAGTCSGQGCLKNFFLRHRVQA